MAKKPPQFIGRRSRLSPEDFVRAWQSSASINEVVVKTGLGKNILRSRANSYQKLGIKLKKLPNIINPLNVTKLKALAIRLGKKKKPTRRGVDG